MSCQNNIRRNYREINFSPLGFSSKGESFSFIIFPDARHGVLRLVVCLMRILVIREIVILRIKFDCEIL